MAKNLTDRMKRFADAYFITLNGVESARQAGYQGDNSTLATRASELLKDDRVQAYLQEKRDRMSEENDATLNDVLDHLKLAAFANIKDFAKWTRDSVEFIESDKLDRASAYAIKKIKGKKRPVFDKEGNLADESLEFEVELCNKEQALKTLATYYGIDSDWNAIVAGLARFNLVLKEDTNQPSGWRVDRLEKK